ncbi:hypothetical protein C8F01DRAFT_1078420 [Mycena amicta]|nr:hypothetical protein C8F01DRAFT_1078420 [Mycena amicta]
MIQTLLAAPRSWVHPLPGLPAPPFDAPRHWPAAAGPMALSLPSSLCTLHGPSDRDSSTITQLGATSRLSLASSPLSDASSKDYSGTISILLPPGHALCSQLGLPPSQKSSQSMLSNLQMCLSSPDLATLSLRCTSALIIDVQFLQNNNPPLAKYPTTS